jgi:hypothetical protein
MACKQQIKIKSAAKIVDLVKRGLNIRSGITIFVVSRLSRQSVHRAVETAQTKCVLVVRASPHDCSGKLGTAAQNVHTLIHAWNVGTV